MESKHSAAVITVESAALEPRLCSFMADESDFPRKGVTVNSIKMDVAPLRFSIIAGMDSFVASVHVGITEP